MNIVANALDALSDLIVVADLSSFSQCWMITLLHFLWQGALVGGIVFLVDRLLRRSSPNLRYGLFTVSLLALPICVIATFILVKDQPPVSVVLAPPADAPVMEVSAEVEAIVRVESETTEATADPLLADTNTSETPPAETAATSSTVRSSQSRIDWLRMTSPAVLACYVLGVVFFLCRVMVMMWGGQRLRKAARTVVDEEILATVARISKQVGLKSAPIVAWCDRVAVPTVLGVLRPTILIPASLVTGLDSKQLEAILSHEMVHIRRFDLWMNLLQRVIESLLFFHPAVWYVSRQISNERESCCDDLVVETGQEPMQYAGALLRVAELCANGSAPPSTMLAASGGNVSQLETRILRLISNHGPSQIRLNRGGIFACWMLLAVVLLGPLMLPVFGGSDSSPLVPTDTNQITDDEPDEITPSQLMAQLKERDAKFARSNIRFHRKWSSEVIPWRKLGDAQFIEMKGGSKRRLQYSDINLEFHTSYSKLRETAVLMTTNDRSFRIENHENKTTHTEVETGLKKILGSSYAMVMSQDPDGRCDTNPSNMGVDPPLPKWNYDNFSFESNMTYLAFASGYGIGQRIVSIESVRRDGDLIVAEGCVVRDFPTHGGQPRKVEKHKGLATGRITFTKDLMVREATLKKSRLELQADGGFKDVTNVKHTPNQQDTEHRIRIETTGQQQFDGLPILPVSGYAGSEIQYNNDGKWHSWNSTGCQVAIIDASAGSEVPDRMRTKMDNATWKPQPVTDPSDQYSPQSDSLGKLTDDGEFYEFPFTEKGIAEALRGRSKILARGEKKSTGTWFPKEGEDSVVEEILCQKFAELLLPELKRYNAKVRIRKSTDELQFFVSDQHVWQVDRVVVQAFESLRRHRKLIPKM